ncbi:hypothetical protein C8R43DRAFT_832316, partial [Mycena crocata]
HFGTIVQVGWNAGPRHARVFGTAKSYAKRVDPGTQIVHDEDVIAAITLTWNLCKSLLPCNITDEIERILTEENLPRMAMRNVSEDTGFKFELAGKVYEFPKVVRAPPEGMFSEDY